MVPAPTTSVGVNSSAARAAGAWSAAASRSASVVSAASRASGAVVRRSRGRGAGYVVVPVMGRPSRRCRSCVGVVDETVRAVLRYCGTAVVPCCGRAVRRSSTTPGPHRATR
ncbi:Uncharacterised protein [Mycobacteroides abscessus]|nr:Uncharacterised protein [Mycobacteroides abscessus]